MLSSAKSATGRGLDAVSRQLGHASVAITADVYEHPDDQALAEAARTTARAIR